MSHHPNIRTYMATQRRERSASQLLQKQKIQDEKLRIQCALERVSRQAERARRSSALAMGKEDVSSVTVSRVLNKIPGKVPKVVKMNSHSPFSDVTNRNDGFVERSFDETSRALFGGRPSGDTANMGKGETGKSSAVKSSVKKVARKYDWSSKSPLQSASPLGESKENNPVDSMPKETQPRLDPRRQWELEPLQNALRKFAMSDDTFQMNQSEPNDFSVRNDGFGPNRHEAAAANSSAAGLGNMFTLNRYISNQKMLREPSRHSVISLCMQNYLSNNADQPLENEHDNVTSFADTIKESNVNGTLSTSSLLDHKICHGESVSRTDEKHSVDCNTESLVTDGLHRAEEKLELLTDQRVHGITRENCNEQKLKMDSSDVCNYDDNMYEFQEDENGAAWIIRPSDSTGEEVPCNDTEVELECLGKSSDSDSYGGYESSFVSED